jgi:CheY-like chemotaxis protein
MSDTKYILYADDDPDDIEFVSRAFAAHVRDVRLILCRDGWEAVQYLRSCAPDTYPCLIVLDINMPKMGGREALLKIREHSSLNDIPVVFFTTSSYPGDQRFAEMNGAGLITKPIDSSQMRRIVETLLSYCSSGLVFDKVEMSSN